MMLSPLSLPVVRLAGYAPALPTPFDGEDKVDLTAVAHLCDHQIRHGATALVVCGTTGEAPRSLAPSTVKSFAWRRALRAAASR